ncbi:MAG: FHA domain-containing protein, partial [Planctomycetota bacterium]
TITFPDPGVEWSHARIYHSKGRYWIEDLQSRGGVRVNGRRVLHKALADGDRLAVGETELVFERVETTEPPLEATEPKASGAASAALGGAIAEMIDALAAKGADSASADAERHGGAAAAQASGSVGLAPSPEAGPPVSVPQEAAAVSDGGGDATEAGAGPQEDREERASEPVAAQPVRADDAAPEAGGGAQAGADSGEVAGSSEASAAAEGTEPAAVPPPVSEPEAATTIEQLRNEIRQLREQLEKEQEENADLRTWIATLEQELKKKRDGLSLAAESFVEQLERAKERIHEFAKRHAETEQALRQRDEEIERLRQQQQAVQQQAERRIESLMQKLEAVRRDFEEMDRLVRAKAKSYARLLTEARAERSKFETVEVLPVEPAEPALTSGVHGAFASGVRSASAQAGSASPEPAAPAPIPAPAVPPEPAVVGGGWLGRNREVAVYAVFGLVLVACVYLLVQLLGSEETKPGTRTHTSHVARFEPSPSKPASPGPAAAGLTRARRRLPTGAGSSAAAGSSKHAGGAKPAPAARTVQAGATKQPANDPLAGDLLEPLRQAHRKRDRKAVEEAEQALIARGASILDTLKKALEQERQFYVKTSIEYVIFAIEGRGGVRGLVESVRNTTDTAEQLRRLFMLRKFKDPQDVAEMAALVQSETNPRIKKYLIQAIGLAPGRTGADALEQVVRSDSDQNARIEAIRALENKKGEDTVRFLLEVAQSERNASVRSAAVRSLAQQAGREAVTFFSDVLQRDSRLNNRAEAAKYFGRVGAPEDLPLLESLYQSEEHHYIKNKIKQAIERIRKRGAGG